MKKLRLALPKGSLYEETVRLFKDASLDVQGDEDLAWIDDERVAETVFFRAQEIAKIVEDGHFDLGITGYDWILESDAQVSELSDLAYGKVRLVTYVLPESGINDPKDVRHSSTVTSEYERLAKQYFEGLGIPIVFLPSYGATEQKVMTGIADVGFDNTVSGRTIRKAGLKVVGDTVLHSSARLIANKDSYESEKREYIDDIKTLLEGARDARDKVILEMNVPQRALDGVVSSLPAMRSPTVSALYNSGTERWYSAKTVVSRSEAKELIPKLKRAGAQDILEYSLTKVIA